MAAASPGPATLDAGGSRSAIRAFGTAATALGELGELDDFLHLLVAQLCELVRVPRCSLYLRDDETGLYRGQVGHGAEDRLVKRLTCGLEADRFTREIVDTRAPVVLRDAMHDPRAIVSTMRAWGVQSVLGVPMVQRDEVIGIFFLDSEDHPHHFTAADEDIASAFAELAAVAVAQARLMTDLRASLATVARQNAAMRRAAAAEERLTGLVIEGAELEEIAQAMAELTRHPCTIHGPDLERLATGTPPGAALVTPPDLARLSEHPDVAQALADGRGRAGKVEPLRDAGLRHRLLIAPVTVRDERWGTVVLAERDRRFTDLDALVIRRAASIVALELSTARRTAAARFDARMTLAAALVRGGADAAELERHAAHVDARLGVPHVICLFAPARGGATAMADARAIAAAFADRTSELEVLTTAVADGVAALLEVPSADDGVARATELVRAVCRTAAGDEGLVAGVSHPCDRLDGYAGAYAEARQVTRCLRAFANGDGGPAVLRVDQLGAARVFLATCDPAEAQRFAAETLGALRTAGNGGDGLLVTLDRFLRCAGSVRRSAEALGVHENTVRYRLARVEQLTGLAVATDADAQLSAQLALAVLLVQGER